MKCYHIFLLLVASISVAKSIRNVTELPIFIENEFGGIFFPERPVFPLSIKDIIKNELDQFNITEKNDRFILEQQLQYCPSVSLCNISSIQRNIRSPCCEKCKCTANCYSEGTCCPDIVSSTKDYRTRVICVRPQLKPYTFERKNFENSYYMVNKCSNIVDKRKNGFCEKILGFPHTFDRFLAHVPVTSTYTNVTYRNKYCALCNDENELHINEWKATVSCQGNLSIFPNSLIDLFKFLEKEDRCNIFFFPKRGIKFPNSCNWGKFTRCNQTGEMDFYDIKLEYGCELYTSLYSGFYRNVFCYMCNRKEKPKTSMCDPYGVDGFDIAPFNALLDFRVLESESENVFAENTEDNKTCMLNQRHDPYKNVCQNTTCSPGFIYLNDSCESVYTEESTKSYEVFFKLSATEKCLTDTQCMSKYIKAKLIERLMFLGLRNQLCSVYISANINNTTTCEITSSVPRHYLVTLGFLYRFHHNIIDVITNVISLENHTLNLDKNVCNNSDPLIYKIQLDGNNYSNMSQFGQSRRFYIDPYSSRVLPTISSELYPSCRIPYRLARITKTILCPRINLSKSKYEFSNYENRTCIAGSDICFLNGQYTNETNDVIVCTDLYFSQVYDILNRNRTIHKCSSSVFGAFKIVSVVFTTLSIICLLIVLIVYSVFKDLRSTPGKNNMALAVNLLIAQILYQFGSGQNSLLLGCKIIGIAIHFFWLAAIFWMNSCTIHMFRVFTKFSRKSFEIGGTSKNEVIKYGIYSYSVSFFFVLVNIIIRLVLSNGEDIGYGECVCFISTKTMVGFTFALPVGLMISINILLFLAVIISIQKMPNVENSSIKNRKTFLIYIKLSCLTGIAWIFGFLYQWILEDALAYIFIILNAGQGIYIMLAFICNKRVFNMIKERCSCCLRQNLKVNNSKSFESNKTLSTSGGTPQSTLKSQNDKITQGNLNILQSQDDQYVEICSEQTRL